VKLHILCYVKGYITTLIQYDVDFVN